MGMLSTSHAQQYRVTPLTIPDTPPGLVSPSSSTYSSIPSEGRSPRRSRSNGPLSPPMSSYDRPSHHLATRSGDMKASSGSDDGHTRRSPLCHQDPSSARSTTTSQRLPPLSSLFPANMRTLPSPSLERPAPYPATSPLDGPRSAGGYLERSGSTSSYFPQSGPSSLSGTAQHPRALYEPPLFDRGAPPPPPRTAFPGPLSPGLRDSSQAHRRGSSSRWSYQQDIGRSSEYSFGGREHPAKYHPQQLAGQKHSREEYPITRDYHSDPRTHQQYPAPPPQQQHPSPYSHHHQQQQQQQPPASTTGETIPTKDGLGPKIWTGTHFLPRFVRAAEVPGEGMCYFYDDGSHCQTSIDGEVVNAHWGVTKAGKPRKRLAIACITCREKKIKCDPDYPRCVQCEKFGRVCKFKNAPRGGGHHNTSPTSESAEPESTQRRLQPHEYHAQQQQQPPRAGLSPSVSPRTTVPALTLAVPPKRVKYESEPGYHYSTEPVHSASSDHRHHSLQSPSWPPSQQQLSSQQAPRGQQLPLPRLLQHDDVLFRQQRWRSDLYAADPRQQHREIPRRADGTRV